MVYIDLIYADNDDVPPSCKNVKCPVCNKVTMALLLQSVCNRSRRYVVMEGNPVYNADCKCGFKWSVIENDSEEV